MFLEAVNKPYVGYEYYSGTDGYMGVEIKDETTFNRMVKRVTPILDKITFNRVKKLTEIPDCVKDAVCAMCEAYAGLEVSGSERKIKSENNDGFSQTFKEYDENAIHKQVANAGKSYLANTGLLYKGVYRDDDKYGYNDSEQMV